MVEDQGWRPAVGAVPVHRHTSVCSWGHTLSRPAVLRGLILSSLLICSMLMGSSLRLCTGGPRVGTSGRTSLSYFLASNGFYTFPYLPVLFSHSIFYSLSASSTLFHLTLSCLQRLPKLLLRVAFLGRSVLSVSHFSHQEKTLTLKWILTIPPKPNWSEGDTNVHVSGQLKNHPQIKCEGPQYQSLRIVVTTRWRHNTFTGISHQRGFVAATTCWCLGWILTVSCSEMVSEIIQANHDWTGVLHPKSLM